MLNHSRWLHVKQNTEIISKLFFSVLLHIISAAKIISATLNLLENVHELQ